MKSIKITARWNILIQRNWLILFLLFIWLFIMVVLQNIFVGNYLEMYGISMTVMDSFIFISKLFIYPIAAGLAFVYVVNFLCSDSFNSNYVVRQKNRQSLWLEQVSVIITLAVICSFMILGIVLVCARIGKMDFCNWDQVRSYYFLMFYDTTVLTSKLWVLFYFVLSSTLFLSISGILTQWCHWFTGNIIFGWILLIGLYTTDSFCVGSNFGGIFFGRFNPNEMRILSVNSGAKSLIYPFIILFVFVIAGYFTAKRKDFLDA